MLLQYTCLLLIFLVKIYEKILSIKKYGKGKEYFFILETNLGEVSLRILLKRFLTF